jgi:hypothetical protein
MSIHRVRWASIGKLAGSGQFYRCRDDWCQFKNHQNMFWAFPLVYQRFLDGLGSFVLQSWSLSI